MANLNGRNSFCNSPNHGAQVSATYYAIKDHQNTVLAMVDQSGAIVERYEYDAWGRTQIYSASGAEISASGIGNRYMFQGREYDASSGLYYFRARWYDPVSGRWLSKDPIGISGGLNLYVFCGNNPVNFVDPDGRSPMSPGYEVWGPKYGLVNDNYKLPSTTITFTG